MVWEAANKFSTSFLSFSVEYPLDVSSTVICLDLPSICTWPGLVITLALGVDRAARQIPVLTLSRRPSFRSFHACRSHYVTHPKPQRSQFNTGERPRSMQPIGLDISAITLYLCYRMSERASH